MLDGLTVGWDPRERRAQELYGVFGRLLRNSGIWYNVKGMGIAVTRQRLTVITEDE
jgi:hypothetical protein